MSYLTPLTPEDRQAIEALRHVKFPVASPDKRMAWFLFAALETDAEITESQREYLYRLIHRYRRQIPGAEHIAPRPAGSTIVTDDDGEDD